MSNSLIIEMENLHDQRLKISGGELERTIANFNITIILNLMSELL